ncbi:TraB/GumN family protein [Qipengyuania sp. ASV99]|uniref:TraB/GumN family protein n=1 Tax=Qipengyuania sp. ASV99 TaxID=3399681 RepID=UPI003A4C75DB
MNHLRLFALACTLLFAACSGGEPAPGAQEQRGNPANPLLYEIANADGEVEGWLLGTVHALPDGTRWKTAKIDRAIEQADILFVEFADLADGQGQTAATFAKLSQTPGLGPLTFRVEPELRPALDRMLERSDIPRRDFETIEDWAAAVMLSRVDARGKPANGADRAVIAGFADRPVLGFETAASQLAIFDRLPPGEQTDLLEGTVREWTGSRGDPEWLIAAWLAGDEARLTRATREGILADPELREALLTGRNRSWMAALEPALRGDDRPLVAVGAAHLLGPDGLAALLEAEGYAVRRM